MTTTTTEKTMATPRPGAARQQWARRLGLAALLVVLAVYPLTMSQFATLQMTLILVYAVAILGLDVLIGWTGQVSLGQSAFFGIGAYTAAIVSGHGGQIWLGLLLGALVAGIVGAIVAIPAARLHGYALGMVTLALPVVAVPLSKRLGSVTGGAQGLNVDVVVAPDWSGLAPDQWRYYCVALVAGLVFLVTAALRRGKFGRAFDAIRAHEVLATSQGVPVTRYKILAFTICATYGGIAGVLYLMAVQFISPETLILTLSISLLASLAIGGLRSLTGCFAGAAFYVIVPNVTGQVSAGQSYLLYGLGVLVVMVLMPRGLAPSAGRLVTRILRGRRPVATTTTV